MSPKRKPVEKNSTVKEFTVALETPYLQDDNFNRFKTAVIYKRGGTVLGDNHNAFLLFDVPKAVRKFPSVFFDPTKVQYSVRKQWGGEKDAIAEIIELKAERQRDIACAAEIARKATERASAKKAVAEQLKADKKKQAADRKANENAERERIALQKRMTAEAKIEFERAKQEREKMRPIMECVKNEDALRRIILNQHAIFIQKMPAVIKRGLATRMKLNAAADAVRKVHVDYSTKVTALIEALTVLIADNTLPLPLRTFADEIAVVLQVIMKSMLLRLSDHSMPFIGVYLIHAYVDNVESMWPLAMKDNDSVLLPSCIKIVPQFLRAILRSYASYQDDFKIDERKIDAVMCCYIYILNRIYLKRTASLCAVSELKRLFDEIASQLQAFIIFLIGNLMVGSEDKDNELAHFSSIKCKFNAMLPLLNDTIFNEHLASRPADFLMPKHPLVLSGEEIVAKMEAAILSSAPEATSAAAHC